MSELTDLLKRASEYAEAIESKGISIISAGADLTPAQIALHVNSGHRHLAAEALAAITTEDARPSKIDQPNWRSFEIDDPSRITLKQVNELFESIGLKPRFVGHVPPELKRGDVTERLV